MTKEFKCVDPLCPHVLKLVHEDVLLFSDARNPAQLICAECGTDNTEAANMLCWLEREQAEGRRGVVDPERKVFHIADLATGLFLTADVNGDDLWDYYACGPMPFWEREDAEARLQRYFKDYDLKPLMSRDRYHICDGNCIDDCPHCGPARSYG